MAARLRISHQDQIRAKIQTSQLINRLTDHALGKIELAPTQVQSIKILLGKTIPDLSAVTMDLNASVGITQYDLDKLNDGELDAVESALVKAAIAGGSESGAGEEEAGSLH